MTQYQMQMFARRALSYTPNGGQSVDAAGEVEADDNFRYVIKQDPPGRLIRASEWLCTHISDLIGIVPPPCTVIEMFDGTTAFGSRRVAGVAAALETAAYLQNQNSNQISLPASPIPLSYTLSAIYCFDMALHNDDRHLGNYLAVNESNAVRLYAYDYSRALFWAWPLSGFPPVGCNTRLVGRVLRTIHPFDHLAAGNVLDRLGRVDSATIKRFVQQMPQDWLPTAVRMQFLDWWTNGALATRLTQLRQGLSDGSLL